MTQTLENLILEASTVLPDGFFLTEYQRGPPDLRPVELLAQYLVAEICGLYSSASDDHANLARLITNLEIAGANLEEITRCFRELRRASVADTLTPHNPLR